MSPSAVLSFVSDRQPLVVVRYRYAFYFILSVVYNLMHVHSITGLQSEYRLGQALRLFCLVSVHL